MALLRNEDTGIDITRFITLEEKQSVIRTEWQTLDGRTYLQRYGIPNATYEIVAYVTYVGKQLLFDAEDTAALLKAECKHGTFYGHIVELKDFSRLAGDWHKTTLTLAPEVVDA